MAEPVYVVEGFRRWMRRQVLRDIDLCRAVAEMAGGLIDADLGSGLLKKRVARSGAGKSGGHRVLVANRRGGAWFFIDGFAKSSRANVSEKQLRLRRMAAMRLTAMTGGERQSALLEGELKEVDCDAKTEVRSN